MRRVIDVIFAVLWLIVAAPLIWLIALLIKLESPGPVLYSPMMIGYKGKPFRLLRFRTLSDHDSEQRLTQIGALIRNYSLDHLPTLINLLKGEMTVIGPRPMEMQVVDLTDRIWQEYFQSKPGLFNYAVLRLGKSWTISREINPALNQKLELEYHQKRSPFVDVKLFFQFLQAYITSRGNIKARGTPNAEMESKGKEEQK